MTATAGERTGQPEVAELCSTGLVVVDDVLRLQVAMDDPELVHKRHRIAHLQRHVHLPAKQKRLVVLVEVVEEVAARQVLHDVGADRLVAEDAEGLGDTRMVYHPHHLPFPDKLQHLLVAPQALGLLHRTLDSQLPLEHVSKGPAPDLLVLDVYVLFPQPCGRQVQRQAAVGVQHGGEVGEVALATAHAGGEHLSHPRPKHSLHQPPRVHAERPRGHQGAAAGLGSPSREVFDLLLQLVDLSPQHRVFLQDLVHLVCQRVVLQHQRVHFLLDEIHPFRRLERLSF
mmetsp:Transcript_12244/g.42689  ORF Transcript_12244/g.42689 Transcript_12244/m.42689 type:complete len:285 (-) Transcript_12244:1451-2305(-)